MRSEHLLRGKLVHEAIAEALAVSETLTHEQREWLIDLSSGPVTESVRGNRRSEAALAPLLGPSSNTDGPDVVFVERIDRDTRTWGIAPFGMIVLDVIRRVG